MNRAGLIATLVLGCGPQASSRSGSGPVPEPEISPPPIFVVDGGSAFIAPDTARPEEGPQCFRTGAMPPGCDPTGEWRLTHGHPEGDCPFGASQHVIRLFAGEGLLCLQPVEDFQFLKAGEPGTCSVVLAGTHMVPAASVPLTEIWASRITFVGAGGVGETLVSVSGGATCMRKFQTTIDRK